MVFDIGAGLYWRLEEGGLLFGWSDPDEAPGRGALDRLGVLRRDASAGSAGLVPVTRDLGLRRIWAATIDYTPDHLPILGPGPRRGRRARSTGVTVASAGGHGMMWGPGVARVAADLVARGATDLVDADRPRARPLRRGRPEPPGERPDRAAVPGRAGRTEGPCIGARPAASRVVLVGRAADRVRAGPG